jgi:predicted TIM-barrel fold metal-dependent hydrolase
MIDVQVYLGRWPFRRLPLDEPARLVERLRALGITQAWAGSFEALLNEDVAGVNARLVEDCQRHGEGFLVPFGAVNPRLPDWREDLRRCHEVHAMRGIRLHPNYHGYPLDDPSFRDLLAEAAERRLMVQIAQTMEDERTQHPLLHVPPVDPTPIAALVDRMPELRVVLLNALGKLRGAALSKVLGQRGIAVEIATLEGVGGLESLIAEIGSERIMLGSLAPLFAPESAVLKLKESSLTTPQREAITQLNARSWLP